MNNEDRFFLLSQCLRILSIGGMFIFTVPDFKYNLKSYLKWKEAVLSRKFHYETHLPFSTDMFEYFSNDIGFSKYLVDTDIHEDFTLVIVKK